jgi:hypothetical protein
MTLPFEIADKSTEKLMTWDDAVEYVKNLGSEWRLPTLVELTQIYDSKNDFDVCYYWSSDEVMINYARAQNFTNGNQNFFNKTYDFLYVRAVKDIK